MPQINFEIEFLPDPPQIKFKMSAAADVVNLKVSDYNLKILLTPDRNAITNGRMNRNLFGAFLTVGAKFANAISGGKIVSKIGRKIQNYINDYATKKLKDYSVDFPLNDTLRHSFTLQGVPITLSAKNVAIDAFDGCIMAFGDIVLS